jgi:uncharacterized protein YodC (DUF2158 family)
MSLKVGQVVKLRSGGPLMTITGTSIGPDRPPLYACSWFDKDNREQMASFPADVLIDGGNHADKSQMQFS